MTRPFRIGTRNSRLAHWQTDRVVRLLKRAAPNSFLIVIPITTTGDKFVHMPLDKIGDRGLFTKEIEKALLDERIDVGVHSLKDLESELPEGLVIGAVLEREDARDALISKSARSLAALPDGATVLTGSLRRKAQLLGMGRNFQIDTIRGNVETRLQKFRQSNAGGLIMACAGLKRLGLTREITEYIPVETMLPAAGQGALAVEIRSGDKQARALCSLLNDDKLFQVTAAERRFMQALQGGCSIPIAGFGRLRNNELELNGYLASLDGGTAVRDSVSGDLNNAEALGERLAQKILDAGGREILEELRAR